MLEQDLVLSQESPIQGPLQFGPFRAHAPTSQFGQDGWILLSSDERFQHRPPTLAQHIGRHRRQLDVRTFQQHLYPIDFPRPCLHQMQAARGSVRAVLGWGQAG